MPAPSPTTEICSSGVITWAVVSGYGLPTVSASAIPAIRAIPGDTNGNSDAHATIGNTRRSPRLAGFAEPNSSRQLFSTGRTSAAVGLDSGIVVDVIPVNLASEP